MASQRVVEVRHVQSAEQDRVHVHLVLACGCEIQRELPADRFIDVTEGDGGTKQIVVGKYPCPKGHALAKV